MYVPLVHPLQLNHCCQNHTDAKAEITTKQNENTTKTENKDMLMPLKV